jgi:DNA polymerase-4
MTVARDRKIVHIDMDAFYASIEQLDNPELQGQPVIVGGRPDSRGVVAACSYEARRFGIRSAMPCSRAFRLCPEAIFIRPRMNRYRQVSEKIMKILKEYTDTIEPLSLDEAYLDISENKKNEPSATILARRICEQIYEETGLTASAGVSCNKFVAKIASDQNKPNGISVIRPEQIPSFLESLPIGRFYGVGKVTEAKMIELGIKTGKDLKKIPADRLIEYFGKHGNFYYQMVRGIDPRPVQPNRTRKSIGAERTLAQDTTDMQQISEILDELTNRVWRIMNRKQLLCYTITIKIRYGDFTTITRSHTARAPLSKVSDIRQMIPRLLADSEAGSRSVRLLGISLSRLAEADRQRTRQLRLPFDSRLPDDFGSPPGAK